MLGDAETLGKTLACPIGIHVCIQQDLSEMLSVNTAVSSSSSMPPQPRKLCCSAYSTISLVGLSRYNQCTREYGAHPPGIAYIEFEIVACRKGMWKGLLSAHSISMSTSYTTCLPRLSQCWIGNRFCVLIAGKLSTL